MREGIHPTWYPDAKVSCSSCGRTWTVGSTRPSITLDICSNCHPFYTGEQRIVDTEGQVDRFMKRLEARGSMKAEPAEVIRADPELALSELGIGSQYIEALSGSGVNTAADFISRLQQGGDEAILEIRGIGRKVLTDTKKKLRGRGYELPTTEE
ncbi:MAG TPA: 50S ribosomal protein L31 [Aggregatilineales bacterium]|nr:50S ribosomal protein L31 [Aggregatilineales bacterium]